MFTLAAGKARTGRALGNPVLSTEGRVTLIDGILAAAVLAGLILNAALGWLARALRCGQCARTLVRLACSASSRLAGSRRIQLVMWRTLGGAGTAGGAMAWP
jgi:hypothetical protein